MNNERLEYLGDAMLGAVIADILYKYFPNKDEGFLTQIRSKIVSRESLNKLALKLGLDNHVVSNVNNLLLPILEKLKMENNESKYINMLKYQLEKLTSSYGSKIVNKENNLTPREVEICNLVHGGLVNKDIAQLLNISYKTVETHRKKIRAKLGLANKDINLVSYLRDL